MFLLLVLLLWLFLRLLLILPLFLPVSCLQAFGAVEEMLPFTDIIPTATLAW